MARPERPKRGDFDSQRAFLNAMKQYRIDERAWVDSWKKPAAEAWQNRLDAGDQAAIAWDQFARQSQRQGGIPEDSIQTDPQTGRQSIIVPRLTPTGRQSIIVPRLTPTGRQSIIVPRPTPTGSRPAQPTQGSGPPSWLTQSAMAEPTGGWSAWWNALTPEQRSWFGGQNSLASAYQNAQRPVGEGGLPESPGGGYRSPTGDYRDQPPMAPQGPPPVVMQNPVFGGIQQPMAPVQHGMTPGAPGYWLAMADRAPQTVGSWMGNAQTVMPTPAPRPVVGAPNLNTIIAQQQAPAPLPAVVTPPAGPVGPGFVGPGIIEGPFFEGDVGQEGGPTPVV